LSIHSTMKFHPQVICVGVEMKAASLCLDPQLNGRSSIFAVILHQTVVRQTIVSRRDVR